MEAIVYGVLALIYTVCAVLCYRMGIADGMGARDGVRPILAKKKRKLSKAEQEQQRISEAVESFR